MTKQATKMQSRPHVLSGSIAVSFPILRIDGVFGPQSPLRTISGETGVKSTRRLVFIDRAVWDEHGHSITTYFAPAATDTRLEILNLSEEQKDVDSLRTVIRAIEEFDPLRRAEPVVAIGGGVLMDVVGFASSIFRRGLPYVRVPSTLIGQVDAGVGVKTGINLGTRKNKLGAYHAPIACLNDQNLLQTVPMRHISSGMAEILKVAIVKDYKLFEMLEAHGAAGVARRMCTAFDAEVMDRAIVGMVSELETNLTEHALERLMDFGHTFSPQLELELNILHGESVALDMAICSAISCRRGLLSRQSFKRILELMVALQLPIADPRVSVSDLDRALTSTTRHRDGKQRAAMPTSIGGAHFVNDISTEELAAALNSLRDER